MPKALIDFKSPMLEQMDAIAEAEHRTRSDLIREAVRRYIENYQRRLNEIRLANGSSYNAAGNGSVTDIRGRQPNQWPQLPNQGADVHRENE